MRSFNATGEKLYQAWVRRFTSAGIVAPRIAPALQLVALGGYVRDFLAK